MQTVPGATQSPRRQRQQPKLRLTKVSRAQYTQPSEPILFPKLRIYFADFPYLLSSNRPEAANLGDLMRLSVRPGVQITTFPPLFTDSQERTGHPENQDALPASQPYLQLNCFQGMFGLRLLKSKDNASQGTRLCRGVQLRYRTVSTSWLRNIILIPFRATQAKMPDIYAIKLSLRTG